MVSSLKKRTQHDSIQSTNNQASISKKTKMSDLVGLRIKVMTLDGRQFVGKLLSFDKHMNLVISECEEFRITSKSSKLLTKQKIDEAKLVEEKRYLGLIILRGENVISLSVEGGVSIKPTLKKQTTTTTSSSAKPNPLRTNALLTGRVRKFQPPPGFKN